MHQMLMVSARADHHDQQIRQQQQQQQQQTHQQTMQHQNESHELSASLSVLDTLSQAQAHQQLAAQIGGQQQVIGLISDLVQPTSHLIQPVNHQQARQQQQQQQPHLHQLQPSHTTGPVDSAQEDQAQMQQQQHQQQQAARQAGTNLLRQRSQIEGIIADGSGPIVQWLTENYEVADGESLPRSTVYNHYLSHCRHTHMASVNAASFGKLIRSVFMGLKTRRLGTRGHSKYHYFGVRAKQHIRAEFLRHQEAAGCSRDLTNNENSNQNTDNGSDTDSTGNECGRLSTSSSSKRLKGSSSAGARSSQMYHMPGVEDEEQQHPQQPQQTPQQHHVELAPNGLYYSTNNGTNNGFKSSADQPECLTSGDHYELADFRHHLGANWSTLVDEHWPPADELFAERLSKSTGSNEFPSQLTLLESRYKNYYRKMVELLSELKFLEVEQLWLEFWRPTSHQEHQWASMATVQLPADTEGADDATRAAHSGQTPPERHQQLQAHNGRQQQQQTPPQAQRQQTSGEIPHQHLAYQSRRQQTQPQQLTFHQMYQLTSQPLVIERINHIDYNLYAAIESFLLPDMLSPIPRQLSHHIRMFAKNIGSWIETAVKDYEPQFVAAKSRSARAFGYALRRYTSLNHLSTASRAIWEKRSSLTQMSLDLSRVDLRDIEHQVSLMSHEKGDVDNLLGASQATPAADISSNPPDGSATNHQAGAAGARRMLGSGNQENCLIGQQQSNRNSDQGYQSHAGNHPSNGDNSNHQNHHPPHLCAIQPGQLIQNFLHLLEDPYPANSWPDWCRNLVESRVCGLSLDEARNFVLKWNFYISLIMKELTLRSAKSFGSFQLIRLLFDEYIFYLVVTRLAQAQHKTPAQMLSL